MKKILLIQPMLPSYSIAFLKMLNSLRMHEKINDPIDIACDVSISSELNAYTNGCLDNNIHQIQEKKIGPFIFRPNLSLQILKQYNIIIFNANPRDLHQIILMIIVRIFFREKKILAWGMFHRIGAFKLATAIIFILISILSHRLMVYSRIGALNLVSLGVNKNKIRVIGTAIDSESIFSTSSKISRADLEKVILKHKLSDNVAIQVVRLSKYKKPELIIYAAEILRARGFDFTIFIIGGGQMFEFMKSEINYKGLSSNLVMLGPIYDEDRLRVYFSIAKIFVIPTCIGLSAHHALSYGLPIVTDNSLDCQASEFDILSEGLNCLLYEEGDVYSMANAIEKLFSDHLLLQRMSINAKMTVQVKHTLKNKAERFQLAIQDLFNE